MSSKEEDLLAELLKLLKEIKVILDNNMVKPYEGK